MGSLSPDRIEGVTCLNTQPYPPVRCSHCRGRCPPSPDQGLDLQICCLPVFFCNLRLFTVLSPIELSAIPLLLIAAPASSIPYKRTTIPARMLVYYLSSNLLLDFFSP